MVKLSKRLQTIADLVPTGARLADIGSDHALLPVHLAEQGRVSFAVAGEVNAGPLEAAQKQVKEAGMAAIVQTRLGDGLAVVEPGEVDVVTIAGMGGSLIVHILTQGEAKLGGVGKLILQPNVGEDQVRRWLIANGWLLTGETALEEDGKFYEVLHAEKAGSWSAAQAFNEQLYRSRALDSGIVLEQEELIRYGPYLVEQADEPFIRKWLSELAKLDKIMSGMARGGTEAALLRHSELAAERSRIEEVIHCLQKVKR
jgi:tRNA (adenine22-N1)-methyltransferase